MGGRIMSAPIGMSNESGEAEINPYLSENTMVVLLAVLCALISILGLISVLPWHYIWRAYEEYMANRLANTGLKKKSIEALPCIVYSEVRSESNVAECSVCLAEFVEGEKVRVLLQVQTQLSHGMCGQMACFALLMSHLQALSSS